MTRTQLDHVARAKGVLERNWLGASTKPSPHLYPHQWCWDSAFIAIGYARYAPERARRELDTLFAAQWKNGMVPQIVFNRDALGGYFPEPDFWQCERSPHHPDGILTSGITMPPVHAIAARRVWEFADDRDAARAWLKTFYPKLLAMHAYLYRERDPDGTGLVYIRHPWESGTDNSPTWDDPLKAMTIDPATLPVYERKDLNKGIPASQRPSQFDYDRYVFLVDLFRRHAYDEAAIRETCPFMIWDPLFNSILAKADEDLAAIAEIVGEDPAQARAWLKLTQDAISSRLWHEEHGMFDVYDLRARERVGTLTSSGLMPLFGGAATAAQAKRIYDWIDSNAFCAMHDHNCFSVPNYALDGDFIDEDNYWRGPVWINTNWLLMQGLRRYGFHAKADSVREDILELVSRFGFHEYFDPHAGTGYGTDDFSWTAALFLDVALEQAQATNA